MELLEACFLAIHSTHNVLGEKNVACYVVTPTQLRPVLDRVDPRANRVASFHILSPTLFATKETQRRQAAESELLRCQPLKIFRCIASCTLKACL